MYVYCRASKARCAIETVVSEAELRMKAAIACVLVVSAMGMSLIAFREAATTVRQAQGPTSALAVELGLDPDTLAVVGCDASDADHVLRRLDEASAIRTEYGLALAHVEEAAQALAAAAEVLAGDPDDRTFRSQYLQAVEAAQRVNESAAGIRRELAQAAFEGLSYESFRDWGICQSTRHLSVPRSFSLAPRQPAQAEALERCLVAERRAVRRGEQLAPEMEQNLVTARLDPRVVTAEERRSAHVALIQSIFDRF